MIEDKATERVKELAKKLGLIINAGVGKAAKPKADEPKPARRSSRKSREAKP